MLVALLSCGCASHEAPWYAKVDATRSPNEDALIAAGAPDFADRFDESAPTMTREQAMEMLLKTNEFAGSAVGYGGDVSNQYRAFRIVLADADAKDAMHDLLRRGGMAGQMYALCGLWKLDRKTFDREVVHYATMTGTVTTFFGGIVGDRPIAEFVSSTSPNAVRLRPGQALDAWRTEHGDGVLDIVGGGYPFIFTQPERYGAADPRD